MYTLAGFYDRLPLHIFQISTVPIFLKFSNSIFLIFPILPVFLIFSNYIFLTFHILLIFLTFFSNFHTSNFSNSHFPQFINNYFALLLCKIHFLSYFPTIFFFNLDFHPFEKHWKFSLSLTFGWDCMCKGFIKIQNFYFSPNFYHLSRFIVWYKTDVGSFVALIIIKRCDPSLLTIHLRGPQWYLCISRWATPPPRPPRPTRTASALLFGSFSFPLSVSLFLPSFLRWELREADVN